MYITIGPFIPPFHEVSEDVLEGPTRYFGCRFHLWLPVKTTFKRVPRLKQKHGADKSDNNILRYQTNVQGMQHGPPLKAASARLDIGNLPTKNVRYPTACSEVRLGRGEKSARK